MKNPKNWTAAAFLVIFTGCLLLVLTGVALKSVPGYQPGEEGPDYLSLVEWFKDTCKAFCTTELPGQVPLKEANARVNRMLGKYIFEGTTVVQLKNGALAGAGNFDYEKSPPCGYVESFRDFVEVELGVPYLYVEAPCKLCAYDQELPLTEMSNQNEITTEMLETLAVDGVDVLDLRERLHEAGMNHWESFYRTDHHWTMDTGLWAAAEIGGELNGRYDLGLDLSVLEKEKFSPQIWEDAFLGSWGRKVTLVYAQPEDFVLPTPMEPVHLRLTQYGQAREGGFEVLYDESALLPPDYYSGSSYGAMLWGDSGYVKVENLDRPDGPVVAVLRESFAGAVGPYLALAAGEVHFLDARYYNGSILDFLRELQPDAVVSLVNVQCHVPTYFEGVK